MIELLLVAERLLDAGDLDRAERIYRQVADADPRNAIAVVGLARVADTRGAHAEAVALAERALDIDPEDEVAKRLVRSGAARGAAEAATRDAGDAASAAAAFGTTAGADAAPTSRPSLLARLKAFLGFGR